MSFWIKQLEQSTTTITNQHYHNRRCLSKAIVQHKKYSTKLHRI
jgi:hypothetical protein